MDSVRRDPVTFPRLPKVLRAMILGYALISPDPIIMWLGELVLTLPFRAFISTFEASTSHEHVPAEFGRQDIHFRETVHGCNDST
jgi:hypothetical protein